MGNPFQERHMNPKMLAMAMAVVVGGLFAAGAGGQDKGKTD